MNAARSIRNSKFEIRNDLSRRDLVRLMALGATGASMSGWLRTLAAETADDPKRRRSCILLWMSGGPTQTDTFDMKPGHANAGEFKEIDTAVSGVRICEHLPKLSQQMQHVAPIRSMTSKEGDHSRASYLLRTGYLPQGPVQYPTLGSLYSKELGSAEAELPSFVSVTPYRFLSPVGSKGPTLIIGTKKK